MHLYMRRRIHLYMRRRIHLYMRRRILLYLRMLTDMDVAGLAWPDIWAACGATILRGRSGGSRCL